jgi:hypothetical protein
MMTAWKASITTLSVWKASFLALPTKGGGGAWPAR